MQARNNSGAIYKQFSHATKEELLEAVFSTRSLPRLQQFGSEASRELTTEVDAPQLDVSSAWELAAEGSSSCRKRSGCKNVSPEAEEQLTLEAAT